MELKKFSDLVGKTIVKVSGKRYDGEIIFILSTGERCKLYHEQNCCENVYVEDIIGDWKDILKSPILKAEKSTSRDDPKSTFDSSWTWTFYHLATVTGVVSIRWYGTSNGYYSESVDFVKC